MQKLVVLVALTVCLFGAHVEGFSVYLYAIRLHDDFEGGGIHNMFMYCTFHSFIKRYHLKGVFRPRINYFFPGQGILIDSFLGFKEEHECSIYEIDVFKNHIDIDAEDRVNDFLGFFKVNRDQFIGDSKPVLTLPGVVSVQLSCTDC